MGLSLTSLVRVLSLLAVLATSLAIGMARLAPQPAGFRLLRSAAYVGIDGPFFDIAEPASVIVDTESGLKLRVALPETDELDKIAISPWLDDRGQTQIVGRWKGREVAGGEVWCNAMGLARFTFPGGEPLERVLVDVLPTSRPCWFPGQTARILYAAGDGMLYQFQFEGQAEETDKPHSPTVPPRPLDWHCPRPTVSGMMLSDPVWPSDPRFRDTILVSIGFTARKEAATASARSELWWLRLSRDGTAIEAAGRLIRHEPGLDQVGGGSGSERFPEVSTAADGSLRLAYLASPGDNGEWQLYLAPMTIDADGTPRVQSSRTRTLAAHCLPVAPAFSTHGDWLNALIHDQRLAGHLSRYRVSDEPVESQPAERIEARPSRPAVAWGRSDHTHRGRRHRQTPISL